MPKLLISFERQNIRYGSRWIFPTRQRMRFEWLALLAFKRIDLPGDQSAVEILDIQRLPSWAGRSQQTIAVNVGRYLQSLEKVGLHLVTYESRWAGPYQLAVHPLFVEFDVRRSEVKKRLCLDTTQSLPDRRELFRFAFSYVKAQSLMFKGRLIPNPKTSNGEDSAYQRLFGLAGDKSYSPQLRLIARLGAVHVLFAVGQFRRARALLVESMALLRRIRDRALKAQFYLALAWSFQRASSGAASDRAVERAISTATSYAQTSGDRASLGLVASRMAGYLTKKGHHHKSVNHSLQALEAHLVTGNYEMVEASCTNIGSVIHRLGPRHYKEARQWLLLGIAIARWMRIGRDNAHGEMILGKIYLEQDQAQRSYRLLKRAQRIAAQAGNLVNLGDIHMVWAFWHQRFGRRNYRNYVRDALLNAIHTFERMKEFDLTQKKKYIASHFPEVWPAVQARL